jgi:hypothetical protein
VLTVAMARELTGRQQGLPPLTLIVNARLVPLFGLSVLLTLSISSALLIVAVVFGIINAVLPQASGLLPPAPNLASIPFGIAGLSMVAVLILRVGFAFNSVLFSRKGIIDSVRESVRLTKGAWGRLVGFILLASAPTVVVLLLYFLPSSRSPYSGGVLAARSVMGLVTGLWSIYGTALWLLAWYRLRAAKDGLTVADFGDELDPSLPAPTPLHQRTGIPRDES